MKHRAAALVALLLASTAPAVQLADADRLQFIRSLLSRELYETALSELKSFESEVPASPRADEGQYLLATCLKRMGRQEEAATAYERVYQDYTNSVHRIESAFERGMLAYGAGDHVSAITWMGYVAGLGPTGAVAAAAHFIKGESHYAASAPAAALMEFRVVREAHTGAEVYPMSLLRIGEILSRVKGQEKEALAALDALILAASGDRLEAEAAFLKGEMQFRMKRYADASAAYEHLLTRFPEDTRATECRLNAAWAAYETGGYSNAWVLAEKIGPAPEAVYVKANSLRQMGRRSAAAETYAGLLSSAPDHRLADAGRRELAALQFEEKRFAVVLDLLGPVASRGNADVNTLWMLAESAAGVSNSTRAAGFLEQMVSVYSNDVKTGEALFRLAYHRRLLGESEAAAATYIRAAERAAEPQKKMAAWSAAAAIRVEAGQDEAAAILHGQAAAALPDSAEAAEARFQKAMCELRAKKSDLALTTLKTVTADRTGVAREAEAYYWMGILERQAGRGSEAEIAFRQAVEKGQAESAWLPNARLQWASVLQANGKTAEAEAVYRSVIKTSAADGMSSELLNWLASRCLDAGEPGLAVDAAQRVISRKPTPELLQASATILGHALLAMNDVAAGEKAYELAVVQAVQTPHAADAALQLAGLKLAKSDYLEASNHYAKAAEWAIDEAGEGIRARAYVGLARTAKAAGDPEQAAKYFLSVGLLYNDPAIVPECLYEAAALYAGLGRTNESVEALKDLRAHYPESEWAKK